ncbi:RNA polymerase sigma factor [Nonomuraea sp. NPDC050556]|uniref:RNA polymerase sigma factor n=1 Tax=Nonomuraea sp. NPDC050556 TaxID=3364369 RepID=UPI0037BDE84A
MGPTDDSLIDGMASGDADATAAFVRRFHDRVFGLALSVVGDAGLAEEVAQDAFVRAWRHAAAFDAARGRASTWLLTIARNLAVDAVRRRRDHPVEPSMLPALLAAEHPGHEPASAGLLHASLSALPAAQSRPVVLAACFGLTAREIAAREGIPLGTAKTRIRRGQARLRQALERG